MNWAPWRPGRGGVKSNGVAPDGWSEGVWGHLQKMRWWCRWRPNNKRLQQSWEGVSTPRAPRKEVKVDTEKCRGLWWAGVDLLNVDANSICTSHSAGYIIYLQVFIFYLWTRKWFPWDWTKDILPQKGREVCACMCVHMCVYVCASVLVCREREWGENPEKWFQICDGLWIWDK